MRNIIIILLALILVSCEKSEPKLPQVVVDAIKFDLDKYPWAKEELEEVVSACGSGVVNGVVGENKCGFTLPEVDDFFVRHPNGKTGLLHDSNGMFKEGVTFFESNLESVPEHYDLREFMKGGMPEIKQQQCGDCWAWSTHHGYEIARAVHDEKPFDHSVQTVLSCSGEGTCGGGYMSAVGYILKGLPFEQDFPYLNGKTGKCKFTKEQQDWQPKAIAAPYVGSSKTHSRGFKGSRQNSVEEMIKAMYQMKGPLVVTVQAFNVGNGVYDVTSACNSGGNHMVAISGWDTTQDKKRIAHIWNSWGKSFGGTDGKGVGKILWNPKDGCLNRGLGVSARVIQYKSPCTPAVADIGFNHKIILSGSSVKMGKKQENVQCSWSPTIGLSDPNSCETYATPEVSTEYHLSVKNNCGTSSAMALVEVYGPKGRINDKLLTPFGETTFNGETE